MCVKNRQEIQFKFQITFDFLPERLWCNKKIFSSLETLGDGWRRMRKQKCVRISKHIHEITFSFIIPRTFFTLFFTPRMCTFCHIRIRRREFPFDFVAACFSLRGMIHHIEQVKLRLVEKGLTFKNFSSFKPLREKTTAQ